LKRRVAEHNEKKLGAKYTSSRQPVKLVYSKKIKNRSLASKAEAQIKKLKKFEKLKLVKNKAQVVFKICQNKKRKLKKRTP
jgi:putative endonuclease